MRILQTLLKEFTCVINCTPNFKQFEGMLNAGTYIISRALAALKYLTN